MNALGVPYFRISAWRLLDAIDIWYNRNGKKTLVEYDV
ncbi:hypothetical protein F3D3_4627 [Fusibacter sp. 3D3]|nr:hypothetical protein F3D3_4627 [Fusibacter sp. 3D3]